METQILTPIKTVADFKRALKVGVKVGCTFYNQRYQRGESGEFITEVEDKGVREVSRVQTNTFALKTPKKDNPEVFADSYCAYPKATECKIEDNKITIYEKDLRHFKGGVKSEGNPEYDSLPVCPILTYWIVAE